MPLTRNCKSKASLHIVGYVFNFTTVNEPIEGDLKMADTFS